MHVAVSKRRSEQLLPAAIAAALVLIGALAIPVSYPLEITNGYASPRVTRPGDKIEIDWRQDWRQLCPITVTREFVGADGFKTTAVRLEVQPPEFPGVMQRAAYIVVPSLPAGQAYYHADIEPHCWIDALWQRKYRTPDIGLTILPAIPAGPR